MKDMRYLKYVIAVILVSVVFGTPIFAFSKIGTLTVQVDKDVYVIEETITISGTVPTILEGESVAIQVFNPRNTVYAIDQLTPNSDGTYSTIIKIGGNLGIVGTYTVKATYLKQSVQTTFDLEGLNHVDGIKVEVNKNVFIVRAKLSNGIIQGIDVDPSFPDLIIGIRTEIGKNGELTITLPRALIDARTSPPLPAVCEGDDDEFIVLVDGEEETYDETDVTSIDRTLAIPVSGGAEEVEIIGSCRIPEFGILAVLVLVGAMGTIIVLSRKGQILKLLPR